MALCLYVGPNLAAIRVVSHAGLDDTTERHRFVIEPGPLTQCFTPLDDLSRQQGLDGVVIEMERGWPGQSHLRFARAALRRGKRVWFYWPLEHAVECIDDLRLATYWRLWVFITLLRVKRKVQRAWARLRFIAATPFRVIRLLRHVEPMAPPPAPAPVAAPPPQPPEDLGATYSDRSRRAIAEMMRVVSPVPFPPSTGVPTPDRRLNGTGVYLRTDYWARITSGGSYGHTCYVAKELASITDRFVCLMGSHFALLDTYGVHQVVMPEPSATASETDLLGAHWFYYPQLKLAMRALRPAFIYERLVQGNFCGAALSQELNIPYIVEYNGSEISMTKSFGGVGLVYEDVFVAAEDVAFQQATMINVVSQVVRDSLVQQGVDPEKILVNPNGADPDVYRPLDAPAKAALRSELGFRPDDCVIGFTGTFGGWHGIDVLADAIPQICAAAPRAKFLLIGDGTHKHLVDTAVAQHGLGARVLSMGRVSQADGARLLGACDLYVSPHNSHMVDSKFFGSPTKLFEYMAMGGGIVGSDLEQLGEVLSPALRVADLVRHDVSVTDQRAVLCTPGDVDEFVAAVVGLVARPDLADALGRNARQAVFDHFSWQRHVANIWRFLEGEQAPAALKPVDAVPATVTAHAAEPAAHASAEGEPAAPRPRNVTRVSTGDPYKEEVQDQWNNNPVGSHYAKTTKPHTLEWYLEVEQYRYGTYSPWQCDLMEFREHSGHKVLEIGGGLGTDLSMFARHGALVTDIDLSAGHLTHARENFALRGLPGEFVHHDAEGLPFPDNTFDVVYSNGVIHHTPNTHQVVREIRRVLKPGGKALIMVYAEHSWHYWYRLVWEQGIKHGLLQTYSIGEIMSRKVEITENDARPLVKVYTAKAFKRMFEGFEHKQVYKRQMVKEELPEGFERWISLETAGRLAGWNVIIKATKSRA